MLFLQAMLIGLAIAAPVGPIGLLCIERTLRQGARAGFVTGLGAATADGLFALAGVLGSATLIAGLTALAKPLGVAGCLFLAWLGWQTLRREPAGSAAKLASGPALWRDYLSTLLLTLGNPLTILSFIAVFASLAGGSQPSLTAGLQMVAGVFAGSALWWWLLAFGGGRLLMRLGLAGRRWLDRLCGVLLLGFAAGLLLQLF